MVVSGLYIIHNIKSIFFSSNIIIIHVHVLVLSYVELVYLFNEIYMLIKNIQSHLKPLAGKHFKRDSDIDSNLAD